MIHTQDYNDKELDALIQDLAQKLAKAKILGETSEAFFNLQEKYESLVNEQQFRSPGAKMESGTVIESDPEMADIPFVDHVRNIPTF